MTQEVLERSLSDEWLSESRLEEMGEEGLEQSLVTE